MKKLLYILVIVSLAIAGCKKDPPVTSTATGPALPFENDKIKVELVTASAPSFIRDIVFINSSTGIAVSYDGKIYKTTDHGVSWHVKYTNPIVNQPFFQALFVDAKVGYVVGGSSSCSGCNQPGGIILKSTDGGDTWTPVFQLQSVGFAAISANTPGELFTVSRGSKGRIHQSKDAGASWMAVDSFDIQLQNITFSGDFGYCIGNNAAVIRSGDNGATWNSVTTLSGNYLTDINFNRGNGYCIADFDQKIYKTTDNGSTWTQIINSATAIYVVNALSADNCLLFGAGGYSGGDFGTYYGKIMQTTDGGNNWIDLEFKELSPIRSTSFYSSTEGYALSDSKLIKVIVK